MILPTRSGDRDPPETRYAAIAMGLFESLRDGVLGVEMVFPPTVEPSDWAEMSFQFAGPRAGVGWWVFFFPEISLDLSDNGWPTLTRDVGRQARALFEQMFRGRDMPPERRAQGPRTNDATWSPLIEVERVSIDGGAGLYALHRMTYEPGSEILMGHLLVPCAAGLAEARWVTTAPVTGIREAVWTDKMLRTSGVEAALAHPGQAVFDDPALDAEFPDHPLSIAREARRWLAKEVRVRVLRPAWRDERSTIDLPALGYSLVPPPRFGPPVTGPGPRGRPWARSSRASISGSDGIDWFYVHAFPTPLLVKWGSSERRLRTEVEKLARDVYTEAGVQSIKSDVLATDGDAPASVRVTVEGDGHLGPLRMVVHSIASEGRIVTLFLMTSATLPAADMLAELGAAARTLRRL